jgi:PQQ-dependent dehydrogenase (methanol/ethanol family)
VNRGHESAPLIVGSTMYVVTPYPNYLYALDLNDAGQMKWRYEAKPAAAAKGEACCDHVCRGAAYFDGKIFFNTLDGQACAVDANTGQEVWKKPLCNINVGETMTMAPIVVKGKVIVGNAGSQFGARGWIQALDAKSGATVWKAYNTGPDSDCLIGNSFHPYYDSDKGKDLGVTTWPPEQWKIGGGTVWGWISYDPQLDLLFYGTGGPSPWNSEVRAGDNKWGSGIFARKPDTGEAIWFYQYTSHDLYGHDGINESVLVDLSVNAGEAPRKVLLHADRNGYLYVMDRQTGQVLSATPFVRITASKGVDLTTGRLQFNEAKQPSVGKQIRDIAPPAPGGKDWQPSAFSPRTNLLYLPHQTLSMDFQETEVNYIAGTPYVGAGFLFSAILFWWALVHGGHRAMGYGLAVLYMFTTALHSGLLGALLTFASTTWYPAYSHTQSWNLTPLEDQQLGGLIMWVPAGLIYVVAGLALFAGWIRESRLRIRGFDKVVGADLAIAGKQTH